VKDNEYRAEVIALQKIAPPRCYFVADLIEATAIVENIPVAILIDKSQEKRPSRARHRIMWIGRNELGLTYSQLARLFNRDHSTCRAGVAGYQKRFAASDDGLCDEIKRVAGEIYRGERPLSADDGETKTIDEVEEATAADAE